MGRKYVIRLGKGLDYTSPALYTPPGSMLYPTANVRIDQNSAKKRWGYDTAHKSMGAGIDVQHIIDYQLKTGTAGTRHTLYLTATDLTKKETSDSHTWSYLTEVYTAGQVTNIQNDTPSSGKATITGDGSTVWVDAMAGDEFILNTGTDYTADEEPQDWATIESRSANNAIVLDQNYLGTTGVHTNNYIIRRVYSIPTNERWVWAIVNDLFCFTNGNTNVQYWDGANYAENLETALTVAVGARYCIEFANRLIIADYTPDVNGNPREPLGLAWSKEGDPTNWTASSAGAVAFLQSADFITGLGKIGTSLFVYKKDSYHIGNRTGNAFRPLEFPVHKLGLGLVAPYSLVDFMGTNAFLGRDNFYAIVGIYPQPIGDAIQEFFFNEVTQAEVEKTWGFVNELEHEIHWIATTTTYEQLDFVYNWFNRQWMIYDYNDTIAGFGKGI